MRWSDVGKVKRKTTLLHLILPSLILGLTVVATLPAFADLAASGDFRGAVEVDGGKIHLECKGAGGPAVILISGYRNNAEIWTVEPGPGLTPVFTGVAGFTRVCAPTIARVRPGGPFPWWALRRRPFQPERPGADAALGRRHRRRTPRRAPGFADRRALHRHRRGISRETRTVRWREVGFGTFSHGR